MDDAAVRRTWRSDYVSQFLSEVGVSRDALCETTLKCLDEMARQAHVATDEPSAGWGKVVLELCRAVESEVAGTLGCFPGLEFLRVGKALGDIARRLSRMRGDQSVEQRLLKEGIKPDFVFNTLPDKLRALAGLRRETGPAHGGVKVASATISDAGRARTVAGEILRGLVRTPGGGPG